MPHPVLDAAATFRQRLLAGERDTANRLVQAYGRAYTRMSEQIEALAQQVASLQDPDKASVMRLAALRSLRQQVVEEIDRFSIYADQEIGQAATRAIQAGINDSRALAGAYFQSAPAQRAFAAAWGMLPVESVETMLGFLADDSPLHQALVGRLGETVAQRMADKLVDAIVLGINPRRIAAEIRRELGVGLTWALTTARTAQLWTYREATRANYMANRDIVSGWRWWASLDNRVCLSCVNQHGSLHSVEEVLNDHHNGRCVALPEVPLARRLGVQLPDIESGEQWFNRLPEGTQQQMMGPGMWDAWRAGAFVFADLSQPYQDKVYGEMLREASLTGLLGEKAREYYR